MDDVVPSALQRLRAADIIRMAGLTIASLGQEYCRKGAVHTTKCQGARLTGIVDVSGVVAEEAASPASKVEATEHVPAERRHYTVEVELQSSSSWSTTCSCPSASPPICAHAAALLYQWLAHPTTFITSIFPHSTVSSSKHEEVPSAFEERKNTLSLPLKAVGTPGQLGRIAIARGPTPLGSLNDIIVQLGLSELRAIAREYEINTSGHGLILNSDKGRIYAQGEKNSGTSLNKQQLAEALIHALRQPEAVRRIAGALEKPQRQLLATLVLAGGSITDDDLQSLFERFSFGPPDKMQSSLAILQGKGLLFRTSLNSSPQQRIGLSGSLLDVGWYIPSEVRAALRVSAPITPFDVQKIDEGETEAPTIQHVEAYSLLADLLLVARALNGYQLEHDQEKHERNGAARSQGSLSKEAISKGSIPAPADMPSLSSLQTLQAVVPRTLPFLRFAVRLLRLADILHKDDDGSPYLRVLPNAAQLLLGPDRADVARDLFALWLTRSGYEDLFDLQDEGLQLCCRTTPLNHIVLRPGELEAENSEARQSLVALMTQVPLDQWIHFPAFTRFVYRLSPTFLQRRQRLFPSPHWWLEKEGRPLQPTQINDWMSAEGRYLARLIRGPLHWWGVSDLALSTDGRLLAFRLKPLAGFLLNGLQSAEHVHHHPSRLLQVAETGEVLITPTSSAWPLIELVEYFAEVAGVRDGHLCYRLTPHSLGEALSRGHHPTALLTLLHHFVEKEVEPDNYLARMLVQLEQWIASYGRIRLYTGVTLLGTADAIIMRELSATTSLDKQVVRAIHPTLLILKQQDAELIVEDLKRRGQVPLLHEEEYHGSE